MIDFRKLIDWPYLIDPTPGGDFAYWLPVLIVFAIIFLAGLVLSFIKKLKATLWRDPIAQWLRWLGGTGLVLLFARYQVLPYLSTRILWYVVASGFLLWLVLIWRKIKQIKPSLEEQAKRYHTFEKYLPRPAARKRK